MAPPAPADVVRALWDGYRAGGLDAALALMDEDVVFQAHVAGGRIARGPGEVRELLASLDREGVSLDGPDDVEERESAVVGSGTLRIRRGDRLAERRVHCVYHLAGERIRRVSTHASRQDALAAAAALRTAAALGFRVDEGDAGGEHVLRPAGELDIATAPSLERALHEVATPGRRVLLDLSGLQFMDSTGLRVIVRAANAARKDGWELRLRQGPPPVRRVFELSGLGAALPFEDA
jgi:anti-sigma B factor antagonist